MLDVILAAVSSLVVGAIYYHPKVLGGVWMSASGMNEDKMKGGNMLVIFGLALVMAFFLAFFIDIVTPALHLANDDVTHGTFGHGALHGAILSVMIALPIITIISLFERKSAKYVLVHFGYWMVTMAVMGGITDAM